jgi:L-alanine-DL-glutamate epimerase-like enolase superfamily enzyme
VKIIDVNVRVFVYKTYTMRDTDGHTHPGPERDARTAILTIKTDDGSEGYCIQSPQVIRPHIIDNFVKPVLVGRDPFDREGLWQGMAHWQRGSSEQLTDRALATVELALWDLAGRKLGLPVVKLIGAHREKILAYASTMCGDELEGGLATPEDYARYAESLVKRGYKAIKLHTWMQPVSWAPDARMDVKACAAVREAVGPDIALMLDAYHWYSRSDALYLGRELGKLGYAWYEEPMEEASMSSYQWLTENLDIPVIGPESMQGKYMTRAEWAKNKACDILRTGVFDVGGIGPSLKACHIAEGFGMNCEIHGNGLANLAVCLTVPNCTYYERGLLHPFFDYDKPPAYLNATPDPVDAEGYVPMPKLPGLGYDINFDYIADSVVTG